MEINLTFEEQIAVLKLSGKLDSNGAVSLDGQSKDLINKSIYWIIDLTQIEYLSSSGIRSILKCERLVKQKNGVIYWIIKTDFVHKVLEMSGILLELKVMESISSALEKIKQIGIKSQLQSEKIINNRNYNIISASEEKCTIKIWGGDSKIIGKNITADDLSPICLKDLGLAFGIGGIGNDSSQAYQSMGLFISSEKFLGIMPYMENSIFDFISTENPSETFAFISKAVSFSGLPSINVQAKENLKTSLKELLDDISIIAEECFKKPNRSLGIAILSQGKPGENNTSLILGTAVNLNIKQSWHPRHDISNDLEDSKMSAEISFKNCRLYFEDAQEINSSAKLPSDILTKCIDFEGNIKIDEIDLQSEIYNPLIWIYIPSSIVNGFNDILKIEAPESANFQKDWKIIFQILYPESSRIILEPLPGGFMAKTFRVTSFDKNSRRMLPTVTKISTIEITRREEAAFRNYVQNFILNNSTSIMGYTNFGSWGGLKYNFLGITGTDTKLTWLYDIYITRPTKELIPIFDNIYTKILKSWYGQPKWEPVYLYRDHSPLRIFKNLFKDAEEQLGVSPETEKIFCEELGRELPNPMHFLKYEYPKRENQPFLWYTSITHGDLNMRNILIDEKDNIYIIDFSETWSRNIVSDFARLEPVLKLEIPEIKTESQLKDMLRFEEGLASVKTIDEIPPFIYNSSDEKVRKAYEIICLLRKYASTVTIFEKDIRPYLIAMLEWTYSNISYINISTLIKKYALYSAALIVNQIMELER